MILPRNLFIKVKPVGMKTVQNEDGTESKVKQFQGIPESCLCANCHAGPANNPGIGDNQRNFIDMSYSGAWKEIDPNLPGNEHYSCVVCGYPINEREVGL